MSVKGAGLRSGQGLSKVGSLRKGRAPPPTWIPACAGMRVCGFRDNEKALCLGSVCFSGAIHQFRYRWIFREDQRKGCSTRSYRSASYPGLTSGRREVAGRPAGALGGRFRWRSTMQQRGGKMRIRGLTRKDYRSRTRVAKSLLRGHSVDAVGSSRQLDGRHFVSVRDAANGNAVGPSARLTLEFPRASCNGEDAKVRRRAERVIRPAREHRNRRRRVLVVTTCSPRPCPRCPTG